MAKEKRKFFVGHFPQGTIVKYCVKSVSDEIKTFVVDHIVSNGPDSWVLVSGSSDDKSRLPSLNICHVTEICSRGKGPLVIKDHNHYPDKARFLLQNFMKGIVTKHPSRYACSSVEVLVYSITHDYMDYTMMLDNKKLVGLLLKQGVFTTHSYHGKNWVKDWQATYYTANKKRLRKRIQQLLPKCLKNHYQAKKAEYAEWAETYDRDYQNVWTLETE